MSEERHSAAPGESRAEKRKAATAWQGFSVSGLEADLAYFQARMEFIGKPRTINQKAQMETFRVLHKTTGRLLRRAAGRSSALLHELDLERPSLR